MCRARYIVYPHVLIFFFFFSNFVQPPSLSLLPPTPTPLLFLLSCFFGWMGDHATLVILGIYTYQLLGPWCKFYATRCQVYWGLTQTQKWKLHFCINDFMWFWALKISLTEWKMCRIKYGAQLTFYHLQKLVLVKIFNV